MECQSLPPALEGQADPLVELSILDVFPISDFTGFRVDTGKSILKDRFFEASEPAGDSVVFPENAVFPNPDQFLVTAVDQHPLKYFIEIKRFGRNMLEIPIELATVRTATVEFV